MFKSSETGAWHCSFCPYSSKLTTNVTRHIEGKHVKTQSYTCDLCQKVCSTRHGLNCHKYRYHPVLWNKHVLSVDIYWIDLERNEILDLMERCGEEWLCRQCGYNSRVRHRTLLHVEAFHVVSGGHNCSECQKLCPSRNALNAHMSRYHRKKKNFSGFPI